MAPETIREHLVKVLEVEQVTAETQALRLLARAARGSMRDALSLTDQAIAFGSGKLEEASVRLMLGSVDRSYVFRLIEALALGDGKTVVETSETLRLNGLSAASTLEEMSTVLQRMAVTQTVGGAADDDTDPEAQETARLAAMMPADETQLLYSICLHGRADLGLAPDEYAALTMVLLRLLAFKPGTQSTSAEKKTLNNPVPTAVQVGRAPVSAVPATLGQSAPTRAPSVPAVTASLAVPPGRNVNVQPWEDEPEPSRSAAASQTLPPGHVLPVHVAAPHLDAMPTLEPNEAIARIEPAQPATKVIAVPMRVQSESRSDLAAGQAAQVLIPTEEGNFWHATVQQLIKDEMITAMVRELALQSQLIARDVDQWILRVERESLNQPGSRDRLTNALQSAGFGVKLVVEIGRVTDSPGRRNSAASAEKQLAAEKIIFDDPFVQSMMRDFGAKIVPGSIKPL